MFAAALANLCSIRKQGSALNIGNDALHSKQLDGGEPQKRRPAWRWALYALLALVAAEAGILALTVREFMSYGFFEKIPIVSKTDSGAARTPPPDLEPGDSNGDVNAGQDDDEEVNLKVGKTPIYHKDPIDPDVVNILALGLDSRKPGGNGRSDMNMVISVDRRNKTVKLVSILRDTLVPIEGHDWNRLNAAYAFGGPGLAINTVNEAYGLDIQRYVKLDFFAIQDIIDAVGGVDVTLRQNEIANLRGNGYQVSGGAGVKHLDGATALAYARIRKIDGDFQRTQRQRNVMTAALGRVRGMGVTQAIDLMTRLLPQVKTNVSTNDAIALAREVLAMGGGHEIKQLALPVQGSYSNKKYKGMSVLAVEFDKNERALKEFLYNSPIY